MISEKDIKHVAGLARIRLSQKEETKMAHELGAILGYIDKLKEVNTDGAEPVAHITGLENVTRKDEASSSTTSDFSKVVLDKEKPLEEQAADAIRLVQMAPEKKDNYVKVRAVFGEYLD